MREFPTYYLSERTRLDGKPSQAGGAPNRVEFQLSRDPSFLRKLGKRVRKVDGYYHDLRGSTSMPRYVTIPFAENDLINDCIREYGRFQQCTVEIAGGGQRITCKVDKDSPDPWEDICDAYEKSIADRLAKGELVTEPPTKSEEQIQKEQAEALREKRTKDLNEAFRSMGFKTDDGYYAVMFSLDEAEKLLEFVQEKKEA